MNESILQASGIHSRECQKDGRNCEWMDALTCASSVNHSLESQNSVNEQECAGCKYIKENEGPLHWTG